MEKPHDSHGDYAASRFLPDGLVVIVYHKAPPLGKHLADIFRIRRVDLISLEIAIRNEKKMCEESQIYVKRL